MYYSKILSFNYFSWPMPRPRIIWPLKVQMFSVLILLSSHPCLVWLFWGQLIIYHDLRFLLDPSRLACSGLGYLPDPTKQSESLVLPSLLCVDLFLMSLQRKRDSSPLSHWVHVFSFWQFCEMMLWVIKMES